MKPIMLALIALVLSGCAARNKKPAHVETQTKDKPHTYEFRKGK